MMGACLMSVGKAGTEDIETLVKMRLSYLIVEKPMSPAFINGRTGMVLSVYTCPSYRRRGCAKIIMEVLLSEAKKMEISVIELKATEDGYPLYRSVGFEDDGSKYHIMRWKNRELSGRSN